MLTTARSLSMACASAVMTSSSNVASPVCSFAAAFQTIRYGQLRPIAGMQQTPASPGTPADRSEFVSGSIASSASPPDVITRGNIAYLRSFYKPQVPALDVEEPCKTALADWQKKVHEWHAPCSHLKGADTTLMPGQRSICGCTAVAVPDHAASSVANAQMPSSSTFGTVPGRVIAQRSDWYTFGSAAAPPLDAQPRAICCCSHKRTRAADVYEAQPPAAAQEATSS